jgi:hypothetical protein
MIIRNVILEIFLGKLSKKINTVTYFIKEIEKGFSRRKSVIYLHFWETLIQ